MTLFGVVIKRIPRDPAIASTRSPQYYTGRQHRWWSPFRNQAALFDLDEVSGVIDRLSEKADYWCRVDADGHGVPIATDFSLVHLYEEGK